MTRLGLLREHVRSFLLACADGAARHAERDELLVALLAEQARSIEPYGRLVRAMSRDASSLDDLPAMPTDVFRFTRVAQHEPKDDLRVFRTSTTTSEQAGSHAFRSMELYDVAAASHARRWLFPDRNRMRLVVLAPPEREAPDSSLAYMLARFLETFGTTSSAYVWRDGRNGRLDVDALTRSLDESVRAGDPIAILGTSFAFVHAEDALERSFALPAGSRIMHTGGTKGRSRAIDPASLLEALVNRYGIPSSDVIGEYGMTELSSQCYENTLVERDPSAPRHYVAPPWMRVTARDPQSLARLSDGEPGILRIDDLANVDSVASIQTADVGVVHGDRFELRGRLPGAVPRGCSRAADAALGGGRTR